jgi:histidine phosphotransferase ChpT
VSARLEDGSYLAEVEARGPRARLRPEVVAGLNGEPLGEGLGGHWVQAYYLHALVQAAGGAVEWEIADERVALRARTPA